MNHTEKTKAQLQNELKEIRQQVIELEAEVIKSSRIMEQSPISIIITDTKGNIEYVNPKFTQITGYTCEEVIGKNPRILKSGEISPEAYKQLWETISSGDEWRGEFHNKNKEWGTLLGVCLHFGYQRSSRCHYPLLCSQRRYYREKAFR
jgi:PAS domain S-box-containing protein